MKKTVVLTLAVLFGLSASVLAQALISTSNKRDPNSEYPAPRILVPAQCEVECPPGAVQEGEPTCYDRYDDEYNGGCNSDPYVFSTLELTCNTVTVCGTSGVYDDNSTRDTDWFQIDLVDETDLSFCCTAEFPLQILVINGSQGCDGRQILYSGFGNECEEACIEATLPAGTYWLWVGPSNWTNIPCGSKYVMTVNTRVFCSFPCWNWTGDCLKGPNRDVSTLPACIRDDNFAAAFPNGLVVGVSAPGRHTATWTSAAAIKEFKCGYGLPAALDGNYVDPAAGQLGSIYGEAVALRLNREFSCKGYFSDRARCYGEDVVPAEVPRFSGLTVDQLLALADQALSGNASALVPYGSSLLRLQNALAYMNHLHEDAGCVAMPLPDLHQIGDNTPVGTKGAPPEVLSVISRPNPTEGGATIGLALPAAGNVSLELYDVRGRRVATIASRPMSEGYHDVPWNGTDDSGAPVASGLYFLRVRVDGQVAVTQKLTKL